MKTKKYKKAIIGIIILSLVTMYGFVPIPKSANATDSLTNVKDLISDSDVSAASSSHTFTFVTGTTTPINGYWRFDFASEFSGITAVNVDCGIDAVQRALFTASTTGDRVDCVAGGAVEATSTQIIVYGVANPNTANSYAIDIDTYDATSSVPLESSQVRVAIIEDVLMTATVDATLTFTISGVDNGQVVNSVSCTATTTATSTPFGTLVVNATSTVCQQLNVTTNASDGFTVTVEQDQELTSDSGDNINSFANSQDGTGSTTAQGWIPPLGILSSDNSYGHMALTSNDQNLASSTGYNDFYNNGNGPRFAGLNGSDPMPVFHNNGPADGDTNATQNIGTARVAYSTQINALQQAGDYESKLTYICTPTY